MGPERKTLEEQIRQLKLENTIEIIGEASDEQLLNEYQRAHLFILPSIKDRDGYHEETQGVVIQEAQASGTIVIATQTGGIPECVDDGRSAFLVPDRDANAIADVIQTVISQPEQWDAWRRAARNWVEQNFATEVVGQKTWQLYQRLIEAQR